MATITINVSESYKAGRANYSSEGSTIAITPVVDADLSINEMRALTAVLQYEAHLSILNAQVLAGDLISDQVPGLMSKYAAYRDAALRKAGLDNVDGSTTIARLLGRA